MAQAITYRSDIHRIRCDITAPRSYHTRSEHGASSYLHTNLTRLINLQLPPHCLPAVSREVATVGHESRDDIDVLRIHPLFGVFSAFAFCLRNGTLTRHGGTAGCGALHCVARGSRASASITSRLISGCQYPVVETRLGSLPVVENKRPPWRHMGRHMGGTSEEETPRTGTGEDHSDRC